MTWVNLFFILVIEVLLWYWDCKTPNYVFKVIEDE